MGVPFNVGIPQEMVVDALMRAARAAARAGRWVFDAGAMALGVCLPSSIRASDAVFLPIEPVQGHREFPPQSDVEAGAIVGEVNPSTGLPMAGGEFDIAGYAYGQSRDR